jgi:multicomponent Na+:H+ antiporter subunit G
MTVLAVVLLVTGFVFLTAGTIGWVRLPDFYTRMHAIGKSDTLGTLLSLLGVACLAGWSLLALKFVAIGVFWFVASPTATHAIARAALLCGVTPWQRPGAASEAGS